MTPRNKEWATAIAALVLPALLVFGGLAMLRWFAFDAQARHQLALMTANRPVPGGDNGYAWIALSDFEIPLDAVPDAMAQEREHFDLLRAGRAAPVQPRAADQKEARNVRYTHFASARHDSREPYRLSPGQSCTPLWRNCLGTIRANTEAARARLEQNAGRIASVERALAARHWRDTFPASALAPAPRLQNVALLLDHIALQAVDGQPGAAMARACRLIDDSRRIGATTNMQLVKLVLANNAAAAADLLLELRREFPGQPMPKDCAQALRPVVLADYSMCNVFRREFLIAREARDHRRRQARTGWIAATIRHLLEHEPLQEAWSAADYSDACEPAFLAALEAGKPMPPVIGTVIAPTLLDPECYAALAHCRARQRKPVNALGYQQQMLASAAKLRLLLAALAHASGDAEVDIEARLAEVQASGYALTRAADNRAWTIKVPSYRSARILHFEVRVPAPSQDR